METRVRKATSADVRPLVALSRRTISEEYSSFLGNEAVASYIDSGAVDRYVAENMDRCIVLVVDGGLVGYSVANGNLIDLMMVDVHYHGRGLGTALLQHVEETLFRTYRRLVLESFEGNVKANSFYRRNRWIAVRTFTDEQSGIDKIEFEKSRSRS
jgi:GNAT superfamily N-acetyltransferase